jgi:hypothetical protein
MFSNATNVTKDRFCSAIRTLRCAPMSSTGEHSSTSPDSSTSQYSSSSQYSSTNPPSRTRQWQHSRVCRVLGRRPVLRHGLVPGKGSRDPCGSWDHAPRAILCPRTPPSPVTLNGVRQAFLSIPHCLLRPKHSAKPHCHFRIPIGLVLSYFFYPE